MRGQKGIFHNLSILTAGQIVAQLTNVAALVFLAGHLGHEFLGLGQGRTLGDAEGHAALGARPMRLAGASRKPE